MNQGQNGEQIEFPDTKYIKSINTQEEYSDRVLSNTNMDQYYNTYQAPPVKRESTLLIYKCITNSSKCQNSLQIQP